MTTDDIESYFGSIEKVAAFFGITTEAVYQWRNRPGQLIPKGRAAEAAYIHNYSRHRRLSYREYL